MLYPAWPRTSSHAMLLHGRVLAAGVGGGGPPALGVPHIDRQPLPIPAGSICIGLDEGGGLRGVTTPRNARGLRPEVA